MRHFSLGHVAALAALIACIFISGCTSDSKGNTLQSVQQCIRACQTFSTINCETAAADFCKNAEQSCEARYSAHPECSGQLDALDRCAATQPSSLFECPNGLADEIRPYRLSEDACVEAANELVRCL